MPRTELGYEKYYPRPPADDNPENIGLAEQTAQKIKLPEFEYLAGFSDETASLTTDLI